MPRHWTPNNANSDNFSVKNRTNAKFMADNGLVVAMMFCDERICLG